MDIKVFDKQFNLIGILDSFQSLTWQRNYYKTGVFEMTCNFTDKTFQLLKPSYYYYKGNGDNEGAYIETITLKLDKNGDEIIQVKGKFLTNFISQRIAWGNYTYYDTGENIIRDFVNKQCIDTPQPRIIPSLRLGTKCNVADKIDKQASYQNIAEVVEDVAKTTGLGVRTILDYRNKSMNFEVYQGVDRTYKNKEGIPPVIFSHDFENVLSQEYLDSINDYKNVTLVGGEGEGADRQLTTVGYGEGFERYEVFTDAKDIRSTTSENVPVFDEETGKPMVDGQGNPIYDIVETPMDKGEYQKLLQQRGAEKLKAFSKISAFKGDINTQQRGIIYKEDYDLGDVVTIVNRRWGLRLNTRITAIKEVYEKGSMNLTITFGNDVPTLIDKIKTLKG